MCCLTLPISVHLTNHHIVLCCVLGSNWREVEAALDRLVSQEREVATGDSQKGIHNGSVHSVYVFQRLHGVCNSLEGWGQKWPPLTEAYTQKGAC